MNQALVLTLKEFQTNASALKLDQACYMISINLFFLTKTETIMGMQRRT